MINPHGGTLINRYASDSERDQLLEQAESLPAIQLDDKNISDLEMIASGAMSPLAGFMTSADYTSVVENMRLSNGLVWSIPITLAVCQDTAASLKDAPKAALKDASGATLAIIDVEEVYQYDKAKEAEQVYRTTDDAHPGVAYVYAQAPIWSAGRLPCSMRRHMMILKTTDWTRRQPEKHSLKKAGIRLSHFRRAIPFTALMNTCKNAPWKL